MTTFGQTLELEAVTLTQIHIGDGTTLGPENYTFDGRDLIYFKPSAVVARLSPRDRERFINKATQSDPSAINEAFRILRQAVTEDVVLDRIAVSPRTAHEFEQIIKAPDRRKGDVHPFQRTGGHLVIPGSAIKGALRTALLSWRAAAKLDYLSNRYQVSFTEKRTTNSSSQWREMVTELLELQTQQDTTADPFRFLKVSDAVLNGVQSRYEKVVNIGTSGKENEMSMIYECVPPGIRFKITLRIDEERAHAILERDEKKAPRRPLTQDDVFDAAHEFFTKRWEHDKNKFFMNENDLRLPKDINNCILLRIGRFSHFESASLEGLRQGIQPQHRRLIKEGSSRMVVRDRGRRLPFGWILLARPGGALPAEVPTVSTATLARAPSSATSFGTKPMEARSSASASASSSSPTPDSLEGQRGYYEGEEVLVVRDGGDKLIIRYVYVGDEEEIDRKEFKKK
jgi:CRISPR-associated protein Csm5